MKITDQLELPLDDTREAEWIKFSEKVRDHIVNYTVPQYSDKGEDQLTDYTSEECVLQIKKYANRYGKNQRDGQELLDLMKIAHYAAVAWTKEQEK